MSPPDAKVQIPLSLGWQPGPTRGGSVSAVATTVILMTSPGTCALLAQIVPVFLLVFAVRGSYLAGASAAEVQRRARRLANRRWRRDPRLQWGAIVLLFLLFEFALVLGAAEVVALPALVVWPWFALTLTYAAIEFWVAGASGRPSVRDAEHPIARSVPSPAEVPSTAGPEAKSLKVDQRGGDLGREEQAARTRPLS